MAFSEIESTLFYNSYNNNQIIVDILGILCPIFHTVLSLCISYIVAYTFDTLGGGGILSFFFFFCIHTTCNTTY